MKIPNPLEFSAPLLRPCFVAMQVERCWRRKCNLARFSCLLRSPPPFCRPPPESVCVCLCERVYEKRENETKTERWRASGRKRARAKATQQQPPTRPLFSACCLPFSASDLLLSRLWNAHFCNNNQQLILFLSSALTRRTLLRLPVCACVSVCPLQRDSFSSSFTPSLALARSHLEARNSLGISGSVVHYYAFVIYRVISYQSWR